MNYSGLGKWNWRDLLHGLISAVSGAIIASAYAGLQTGHLPIDAASLHTIGLGAAVAGLGYLGKQLGVNSEGDFLKVEPQK